MYDGIFAIISGLMSLNNWSASASITCTGPSPTRTLSVDAGTWQEEAALIREYFGTFGNHFPERLWEEHEALLERLKTAS